MRVLLSISILAFVALLWASIAIARHVRQARRRPNGELQKEADTSLNGKPQGD